MKDSKRIDNKAKSRRIAAYALAGCMAITAAPITMPPELANAETTTLSKLETGSVALTYKSKVSNTTTFAETAEKLSISAKQNDAVGTWASKATKVTIKDADGNLVWNTDGDTSVPGTTKFGYGKTYTIEAEFTRTMALADVKEEELTDPTGGAGITVTPGNRKNVSSTQKVAFYSKEGMLSNEKVNASAEYDKENGKYSYVKSTGSGNAVDGSKKDVIKNDAGWWLVVNGVVNTLTKPTIEKNKNGSWYIGKDGKVDFTKTGIFSAEDAGDGKTHTGLEAGEYYVEKGKVNTNKTGLVQQNGVWYNIEKGKLTLPKESTVVKAPNGRWYYINETTGKSDYNFDGVAKNTNGTWYVEDGVVDFTKEGIVKINSETGAVDGDGDIEYFVLGGKVQADTTGVVFYKGESFYVTKGVVGPANFDDMTLAKDVKTGKWYALDTDGKIANHHYGLVKNIYGTWYVADSVVDFEMTGIIPDEYNEETDEYEAYYYVEGGKVQTGKNGLVMSRYYGADALQVFNLKEGKVTGLDANKNTVKASNGKWYVIGEDGTQAGRTLGANSNGIWISSRWDGTINFDEAGLHEVTEEESAISGLNEGDIVYIKGSKVQTDVTGFVKLEDSTIHVMGYNDGDIVYVKKGVISDDMGISNPTVIKCSDGIWRYVDENGLQPGYNGVASNSNGTWYVSNGAVKFDKTGFYTDAEEEKTYYFVNSKLATDKTGVVKDVSLNDGNDKTLYVEKGIVAAKKTNDNVVKFADGAWYYVDDSGKVDEDFTGLAENKNGVWYIKKGRVDFDKTGIVDGTADSGSKSDKIADLDDPTALYVVNGKVQLDYTGFVIDGANKVYFEKGQKAINDEPQLVKATDGKWYYIVSGAVDDDYVGLAKNKNGIWYVYNGVVSFGKTGVIDTPDVESANLDEGKYYVANGKMTSDKNGIVKSGSTSYYVQKSAVVTGIKADESVIKVDGTWYCINDKGEVSTPDNKLAANNNGVWAIKDGKVDFTAKGLYEVGETDVTALGKLDPTDEIYVSGGKFQNETTCVYVGKTDKEYVKNGVVTTSDDKITANTAIKGTDGKWYAVAAGGTGVITGNAIAKTDEGAVYVNNGVIDYKITKRYTVAAGDEGVIKNVSNPAEVYIKSGKVATDVTGFVTIGGSKMYVKNGVFTQTEDDDELLADADGTLYYVGEHGDTVIKKPTPLIATKGSYEYYVVNGKVNTGFTGKKVIGDIEYNIVEGRVKGEPVELASGLTKDDNGQYVVMKAGKVDTSKSGVFTFKASATELGANEITYDKNLTDSNQAASLDDNDKIVLKKGVWQTKPESSVIVTDGTNLYKVDTNNEVVTGSEPFADGSKLYTYDEDEIKVKLFTGLHADNKVYQDGVVKTAAENTLVDITVSGVEKKYKYNDDNTVAPFTGIDTTTDKLYSDGVLQKATEDGGAVKNVSSKYVVNENGVVQKATATEAIVEVLGKKYAVDTNGVILANNTYTAVESDAVEGQINSASNAGATIAVAEGVATITPAGE